jgi:hypothetical protein
LLPRGRARGVALDAALEDPETPFASCHDLEKAKLWHVPVADAGEGAHPGRDGGLADFVSFANQADAERRAVLQAGLGHPHVALLENAQRQPAARKQHGVQQEEG